MIFGRVAQERLQLNEDTLWAGAPYTPDNPEARAAIPQVRALLEAGRYKEATELASAGRSWRDRCNRCRTEAWAMCS